jgi:RNA polymerase sigma-70 factor (ECF subfamily)
LSTLFDHTHRDTEAGDASLVAHALQNGPEAFGPIIERYKDAVFGVALARLRNFHDAEDLTQTTFVEALNTIERLKDPARLGAWLRTIAIHRCINWLKRRGRLVDLDAIEEPVSAQLSPADELEKGELQDRVMHAVDRLSKTQHETVMLYYIGEYSMAEVAAIQEVPLGTIKRRLHEARKRLKSEMLTMVADVLKDNAPDDAMAERVFELLSVYPEGKRTGHAQAQRELAQIGRAGKGGFERSYELPHALSRNRAVHFVALNYESEDGPPSDFALELIKRAMQDKNWRVRKTAATRLLFSKIVSEDERAEKLIPLVLGMLQDESKKTRRAVNELGHIQKHAQRGCAQGPARRNRLPCHGPRGRKRHTAPLSLANRGAAEDPRRSKIGGQRRSGHG